MATTRLYRGENLAAVVTALHDLGISAANISSFLGQELTRGAIAGLRHRALQDELSKLKLSTIFSEAEIAQLTAMRNKTSLLTKSKGRPPKNAAAVNLPKVNFDSYFVIEEPKAPAPIVEQPPVPIEVEKPQATPARPVKSSLPVKATRGRPKRVQPLEPVHEENIVALREIFPYAVEELKRNKVVDALFGEDGLVETPSVAASGGATKSGKFDYQSIVHSKVRPPVTFIGKTLDELYLDSECNVVVGHDGTEDEVALFCARPRVPGSKFHFCEYHRSYLCTSAVKVKANTEPSMKKKSHSIYLMRGP